MPDANARRIVHALFLVLIAVFTVIWFLPILFIFLEMFKTNREILTQPWALPTQLRFDILANAWRTGQFSTFYLNSAYVTAASIIVTVVVSALAAYAFARMPFRGSKLGFAYIISGMMISVYTIIIPLYLIVKKVGLMDRREVLILVYSATSIPFSVYFLTMFFRTVPLELEQAARIDGCSRMGTLLRIVLPLARPSFSALVIFLFAGFWNEFYLALIFITKTSRRTVPLGLMYFADQYATDFGGQISAVVIASIPIIVIYFLLQKQFIRGITAGALKG
jgi:raffinose/stachyose/melibiose transport system permease protein